jgi:hypothetical protein
MDHGQLQGLGALGFSSTNVQPVQYTYITGIQTRMEFSVLAKAFAGTHWNGC